MKVTPLSDFYLTSERFPHRWTLFVNRMHKVKRFVLIYILSLKHQAQMFNHVCHKATESFKCLYLEMLFFRCVTLVVNERDIYSLVIA